MENYDYIERRSQIRKARRKPSKRREGTFILKLNTALALGIMVLCANMIDLDITNAFTAMLKKAVTQTSDLTALREEFASAMRSVTGGKGTAVFGSEKHTVTMDEEVEKQMNEQMTAYENTQKKTLKTP